MARRKLTIEEQLRGVEKAAASPRTPPQLKEGLRGRADQLRRHLDTEVNGKVFGLSKIFGR